MKHRDASSAAAAVPPIRELWSLAISMMLVALGCLFALNDLHRIDMIGDGIFYMALLIAVAVPSYAIIAAAQERRASGSRVGGRPIPRHEFA